MKPLSKIIKILTFVFSLMMVFALCGCDMCSTSQPDMVVETADFEYTTILNLKEMYKVSDEELLRDISSYGEEEGFALYKRAYSNFLNTPNYRIVTTGYSKVDTMGGITVDVNNEKKFDGTNFFMHTLSISEKGGITASMSNKNSKHYFYVTDNPLENLATINQLDVKDENKILSTVTCTEKNYVFNYGAIPYAVCDYVVNESTILESSLSFDDETGLYKIEFVLEPVSATVNLVKKMYMISNTSATYKDGSVKYIVYVDSDFIIRKTTENETYNVDAPIVGNVSAEGMTEDCFYYVGDKNFLPLSEDQKYDLSKIPTEEAQEEVNVETQESSKRAFGYIAENGINSNFDLSIGDTSLSGRLQLSTENNIELQIDTEFGEEIMIYLSLDENNNCLIKANYGDIKIAVVVDNVGDAVTQIISLLGVDLDGIDIGDIIANLNIKDFFSSIVGLEGEVENGVYTFESDTSKLGFPLALPFTMSVSQDRITSFELNNVDLEGLSLSLKFEACSEPKNMEQNLIEEDRVDLSSLVKFALNDLDVDLIMSIVENKTVSFDVTGKIFNNDLMLKVDIDFSNEIKAIAQGKIMDVDFSIYFENDSLYVSIADDAVFIDINSIINLFGEVDFELQPIQIEEILSIIRVVINESSYVDNTLNLSYDKLLLAIYDSAISIGYDNNISLEINNISSVCDVYKPDKDYQNILQDIDIELIKEIVENKKVSFDIEAKLQDFELSGNVQLDFNDGIKVAIIGNLNEFDFSIYYENETIFLSVDNIKIKCSVEDILKYLNRFGVKLPEIEIGNIEINSIIDIVKTFLGISSYSCGEFVVCYGDLYAELKDMCISLTYGDNISLNVTNISSSCEIEEKESDYEDILNDIDLDLILEIVENKKVSFDIEAKLQDFELSGNVQLDFNDGIKLQASGTIEGITFSAYLENDIIYLKANGIKVQVSIDELMGYLSELNIELPKIELNGILDIIKDILNNTTYKESEIAVTYNDIFLTLKDMCVSLRYGENISAYVNNISSSCEIEENVSDYEDILNDIDLDLILEIVENKKVSFDIEATLSDFELSGNVQLDFNDGIKAYVSGVIDGVEFTAYYEDEIVYLTVGDVAVSVSINTIFEYANIFTEINLPEVDLTNLILVIKDVLEVANYKGGVISLVYKDIYLSVDHMNIGASYESISAMIKNISSEASCVKPNVNYQSVEGLNKLLESVNKQLSERYFTANGLITLGDVTIELKDIKVHNAGELLDPTTAFNNGDLTLSGVIIITASNKQHKLNISYVNDNLYISYNEKLNIKLSREALDEIVDIVKVNFKNVLERLNYMELIPIETIEKLMNFEFNLGVIPKVLKEISCNNGALTLGLDTSIIDLDKFITLIASVSEYDILSLTVSVDEYDGTITLDNSEFDSIVAPEGDYLEFSGITKLIEGLVNAILKESGEYYLSGKISLSLDSPILGAFGGNVEMGVDVRIRLVDDEESELGKKLEVYVEVNTANSGLLMETASSLDYIYAGKGILALKDGIFYIERQNKKYDFGILGFGAKWKDKSTQKVAVTREYFGSHILEEVGLFLGFGDALNDKINEGATEEKQEIKVEELINNYSVNNGTHEIVLVGSSLLKNDMVSMGNITIDLTLEDLNSDPEIQDEQLTTLKAKVPLTIIGLLGMTAEVDATHDVYKTDIDFSYIENLNPQNYTLLG